MPWVLLPVVALASCVIGVAAGGREATTVSMPAPTVTVTASFTPAPSQSPPAAQPSPTGPAEDPDASQAAAALAGLPVKGRAAKTGYVREAFGWNSFDFDRNGCDQRNDVLARDMTMERVKPGSGGCTVEAGMLQDRYAGSASWRDRGDVDIDHVVALSNAWRPEPLAGARTRCCVSPTTR